HRPPTSTLFPYTTLFRSGLFGVRDDDHFAARLEPALDAVIRIGDDRCTAGGELERAAGRRGVDGRVRAARDVEIDARRRNRTREHVEGNAAGEASAAEIAAEVAAAEGEVHVLQPSARLADERADPFAPELVAVAVEEHVGLLLHVQGREELGIDAPEDGLHAPRAELSQPLLAALRAAGDQ